MQTILVNFGSHVFVLRLKIKQSTDLKSVRMICCLCYHEKCSDVLQECYMAQVNLPQPTLV